MAQSTIIQFISAYSEKKLVDSYKENRVSSAGESGGHNEVVPLTYGKPRLVYQKVTRLVRRYEKVVEATDKATLQGFIGKTTADNAMVYTDGATAYQGLPIHEAVAHSVGEYVREMAHTNGIESFWSMLKRGHYGIYHQMSPTHLGRYVTEFSGRHNARPSDTIDQMEKMAKATYGKRLRYVDLIAD